MYTLGVADVTTKSDGSFLPSGSVEPRTPNSDRLWSREDLAKYLHAHRDVLRGAIRRKLARQARGGCDSEDIASSVMRRLDEMAQKGQLRPASERQLWALIRRIALYATINRNKRERFISDRFGCGSEEVAASRIPWDAPTLDQAARQALEQLAFGLDNSTDRMMLFLRARGATHRVVAETLGITPDAARKRWDRLMDQLTRVAREG